MKNVNTVQGIELHSSHVEHAKPLDQQNLVKRVCAFAMLALVGGYSIQLINSAGDISVQEKSVMLGALVLTLLLIIPIIAVNIYLVSRRRASNNTVKYSSRHSHSIKKEVMAWAIPIVIIAMLTFMCWGVTHSLDLYKPVQSKVVPVRVAAVPGA